MPPSSVFALSSARAAKFICDSCLTRSQPLRIARLARGASRVRWNSTDTSRGPLSGGLNPASRILPGDYSNSTMKGSRERVENAHTIAYESGSDPTSSGIAPLPHRRLVSLSGPDAKKFMQGLITNNVARFDDSISAFYSAFLDARGRVLWDVFVWANKTLTAEEGNWACYIEIDAGELESLVKHLRRHRLRSKVKIEVVEDGEIGVWAGWGDVITPSRDSLNALSQFKDPRAHNLCTRFLVDKNDTSKLGDVPILDTKLYHLRRYLHGVPEGPLEIPREAALPMEYNIDLSNGIDFKKGCYVGQELTIRTKHTGVVRKRVLSVLFSPSPTDTPPTETYDPTFPSSKIPTAGAEIKPLDSTNGLKKGRPAGKFIAGIGNVGLALVRLEMMTSMRVSSEGGSFKPGMRFGVVGGEDGEVLGVTAVVPQWFRERERDLWDKGRKRVFGGQEAKADE